MKKIILPAIAVFALLIAAAPVEDKWFDMENCALCNCMSEHQDLMMEMKWDVHKTEKGMLMVSLIPDKHKETMKAVHEKMMAKVAKMESGEAMDLCGFCMGYGELRMGGSTVEEIESVGGQITLVTSDDADTVKKIHAFADKSKAEQEKMMKEMAGGDK